MTEQDKKEVAFKYAIDELLDQIGMKIAVARWEVSKSKHVNMAPPLAELNDFLEAKQKEISLLYNEVIDEFCP